MNKNTSQEVRDINGLINNSKTLKSKLIVEENKTTDLENKNLNKEIQVKASINSPLADKKIQNFVPSYIPINTLSDMSNNFNLNSNNALITSNEMKNDKKENEKINSDEIIENGQNLDEQNMNNYHQIIENKINIIKKEQKDEIINNKDINNIKSSFDDNKYISMNIQDNKKESLIIENKIEDEKLPFGIQIPKDLFDKIEYAIDENGNPFNFKHSNEESPIKKPVALIIQKENKLDNYLIDLQGKKISKKEDGYFNYKKENTRVIIKDFDVQHPELRIYGTRNKDILFLNNLNNEETEKNENDEDNINKINNNKSKKYEIVLNKKKLDLKHNSPIKIKNIKSVRDSKTDKRVIYNLNKNKKLIANKKLIPRSNTSSTSLYPIKKFSNNYAINRTCSILNKSSNSISYHNRSYTISNSSNNFLKNKYEYNSNTQRTKTNKMSITPTREIKNISCTSSRINLYNYKPNIKKGASFNNPNKLINLKNSHILHRNAQSLTSLPSSTFEEDIKISNYNSLYCNKKSISTNYNSIQSSNIKKNKSSINISSTINNISNKIKYIQNKINNNKISSTQTSSTTTINNSQINNISKDYNTFNNYSYMNQINDNKNSSLYKRQFKCAILSKEVNDIISDYSNTNNKLIKKKIPYGFDNIYTNEIKNNENKINSFLNGHRVINNIMSQRNLNNYTTDANFYNINSSSNNINRDNNINDISRLYGKNLLLNKINSETNNNNFQNGFINFKRRKINSLMNFDNNIPKVYSRPLISENYMHNYNLLNKNKNNRNRMNFTISRNNILNLEENKSQTSLADFLVNLRKNHDSKFNFNYSLSNINNDRNFDFS